MAQQIASSTVKSSKKRNATTAGLQGSATGRSVKRRAAKACQCCRARKVRCNVVEHGSPCTNCRLDEIDCVLSESKRKKKYQGAKADSKESAATRAEARKTSLASSSSSNIKASSNGGISQLPNSPVSPSRQCFTTTSRSTSSVGDFDKSHDCHVPHLIYQTQGQKLSKQGQHPLSSQAGSIHSSLSSQPVWNQSSYNHIISQDGFNQSTRSNLSPYLTPLSLELGEDDFQYLTAKGALNLPAPWLLNQLMRSYQNYIHPALPVLDFQSISEIVKRGDGSNGQISLLLHHALMYAASSYVSTEQWRAAGYVSKKDARADFLEKAKLIESVESFSSPLSLIQSLVLMSSSEAGTPMKNSWHFLGIAISMAQTLGLHRDCSSDPVMDLRTKRLRKRIWWCLYTQDRLQGLEQRRQPRIRDGEYDVPMLSTEDFEIARDPEHETHLAELFISKTKLALIISAVLNTRFNPFATSNPTPSISTCTTALDTWLSTLPAFAKLDPAQSTSSVDSLFLQKANLHLLHVSAVLTLHQNSIVVGKAPSPTTHLVQGMTTTTSSLASQLLDSYLAPYLPSYIVPALHKAAHAQIATICTSQDHRTATAGLSTLLRLIHLLRETYDSADAAFLNLQAALHASPLSRSFEATRAKVLTPPPDSSCVPGWVMPNDEWEVEQVVTPPLSALCEAESPDLDQNASMKMEEDLAAKNENFDLDFWGMVDLDCAGLGGEEDAEGDVDIEA